MSVDPVAIKLGIFAADQIASWVKILRESQTNPDMTDEEADALVEKEQGLTVETSDRWRDYRRNG